MDRILCKLSPLLVVVTLWLGAPQPVFAGVAEDFSPVAGVVILASGESCLIDRDAAGGVAEGDLFTVLGDGEELVHPVSGASLGRREVRKGVLRVVRLHQGYAEAVPVGAVEGVSRGDRVQRFVGLAAAFVDQSTGQGKSLYEELRRGLTHLRWEGYFTQVAAETVAGVPRLLFTVAGDRLEVREPVSGLLRRYPFVAPPRTGDLPAVTSPAPLAVAAEPWVGPSWSGRAAGIEIVDLDGDGRRELVVASEHGLEVGRLVGQDYTRLGGGDYGLSTRILAVDSADGDGDGRPELWVTAASGDSLESFIVVWREGALQTLVRNLGWWFRAVPLPGEGRVLLGQRLGEGEVDYSGPLLRLSLKNGKVLGEVPLAVPRAPSLYGLALLGEGGPLSVRLGLGDLLQVVSQQGEKLWESDEPFGGSELYFERPDPTRTKDGDTRNAYAAPRLEVRDGTTLLVPVNEGRRSVARRREFNRSHLELLRWDGVALRSQWRSRSESGYLVDFRLADVDNDGAAEVVQLVVYVRPGFSSKGKFALLIDKSLP